jgi:hypothetical protein
LKQFNDYTIFWLGVLGLVFNPNPKPKPRNEEEKSLSGVYVAQAYIANSLPKQFIPIFGAESRVC